MSGRFFIAGTDTDVGKTYVAAALLNAAADSGILCAGYKPISAGCEMTAEGLRNADALALLGASSLSLNYHEVNPIAFADPVAPHLAAAREGRILTLSEIQAGYEHLCHRAPELLLVEGAGGWRLPLGQRQYLSDFARENRLPVILVVGMKLGCLNHAVLTAECIERDGLEIVGWIANQIDPDMAYFEENLAALDELLSAPRLATVPFDAPAERLTALMQAALTRLTDTN